MKLKLLLTPVLMIFMLLGAACGGRDGASVGDDGYTNVSVAELREMFTKKDFVSVNTHIPFEGNLPQTDLSIPFDKIGAMLDKLPQDKDAKILLYCRSGNMSTTAAETLVKQGYTNVYELDGGMNAWKQAGLTLEGR
ncbi:MAG: rhodanese-like domain-containing protein [Chloroflexia bacterium]